MSSTGIAFLSLPPLVYLRVIAGVAGIAETQVKVDSYMDVKLCWLPQTRDYGSTPYCERDTTVKAKSGESEWATTAIIK